jgi:hypothetical protein
MTMALDTFVALLPGSLLVVLGCLSIAIGSYALERFKTLRTSFGDDAYLEEKFQEEDRDRSGKINETEFGSLVWTIGLEMTEYQITRAFRSIDTKKKGRINFQQFKLWWFREPSSNENFVEPRHFLSEAPQSKKSVPHQRLQISTASNKRPEALV